MKAQTTKHLEITEAKYVSGYKIRLTFNDGAERIMDFGPFLRKATNPEITQYRVFPIADLHRGEI